MDIVKSLAKVDWTVVEELHHIPKGRKGSFQEALRIEYAAYRKAHREIGADLPPRAALVQALTAVRRFDPEFTPIYDAGFFYGAGRMARSLAGDPLTDEIHAMAARGGDGVSRPVAQPVTQDQHVLEPVMQASSAMTESFATS